jgi:hypothetical protein
VELPPRVPRRPTNTGSASTRSADPHAPPPLPVPQARTSALDDVPPEALPFLEDLNISLSFFRSGGGAAASPFAGAMAEAGDVG